MNKFVRLMSKALRVCREEEREERRRLPSENRILVEIDRPLWMMTMKALIREIWPGTLPTGDISRQCQVSSIYLMYWGVLYTYVMSHLFPPQNPRCFCLLYSQALSVVFSRRIVKHVGAKKKGENE